MTGTLAECALREALMTVVLVHGNPETADLWDPLRSELGRDDVVALSPPGFGAPVPDGFAATSDEYLAWLIGELQGIEGPIDLVGHDWGGGHVQRLAATRPDLIRSWVSDVLGLFDAEYVWHDFAQVWQTEGGGEASIEAWRAMSTEDFVATFAAIGVPEDAARHSAELFAGPDTGRCILALYRSAAQPKLKEWGDELARAEPRAALAIIPTDDPYLGGVEMNRRAAERCGAQVAVLEGLGHWWMLQDPALGAAVLAKFFATLD
jgi:pimeloyl-ACP methyl ester carboxylesterase